ncbi:hypothetical protein WA158_007935 [Blastocystis sp. Blastoise]
MNSSSNSSVASPTSDATSPQKSQKTFVRIKNEIRKIDFPIGVHPSSTIDSFINLVSYMLKLKYNMVDLSDCKLLLNDQVLEGSRTVESYKIQNNDALFIEFNLSNTSLPSPVDTVVRIDQKTEQFQEIKGYIVNNDYKSILLLLQKKSSSLLEVSAITKILVNQVKLCTIDSVCIQIFDYILLQRLPESIIIDLLKWFQGMTFNLPNSSLCINILDICYRVFSIYSDIQTTLQTVLLLRNIMITNIPDYLCDYINTIDFRNGDSYLYKLINKNIDNVTSVYSTKVTNNTHFSIINTILCQYYQNKDIIKNIFLLLELFLNNSSCGLYLYQSKIFEQILFILQIQDEYILSRTLMFLAKLAPLPNINTYLFYYRMFIPLLHICTAHEKSADILIYGILIFRNVASDNERCIYLMNEGVLDYLINQLPNLTTKIHVVNTINTIRNIITHSSLCQDYILSTNILLGFESISHHFPQEEDICKQICLSYQEIAKTNKGRERLVNMKVDILLDDYLTQFTCSSAMKSLINNIKSVLNEEVKNDSAFSRINSISNLGQTPKVTVKLRNRALVKKSNGHYVAATPTSTTTTTPTDIVTSSSPMSTTNSTTTPTHQGVTISSSSSIPLSPTSSNASVDDIDINNSNIISTTHASLSKSLPKTSSTGTQSSLSIDTVLETLDHNSSASSDSILKEIEVGNRFKDVAMSQDSNKSFNDIIEENGLSMDPSVATPMNKRNSKEDEDATDILIWTLKNLKRSTNEEDIITLISMIKVFIKKDGSLTLRYIRHFRYIPSYISSRLVAYSHNEKMHLVGIEVISAFTEDALTSVYLENGDTIEVMNNDITTYMNNIKILNPLLNTLLILSNKPKMKERFLSISVQISLQELINSTMNKNIKTTANCIIQNLGITRSGPSDEVTSDNLEIELNHNIMQVVLSQLKNANRSTKITVLFVLNQLFYDETTWAINDFFDQNGITVCLDIMKQFYNDKEIIKRSIDLLYSLSHITAVLKRLEFTGILEACIQIINIYKDHAQIISSTVATIYDLCKLDSILSRLTSNLSLLNSLLSYYVYKDKKEGNDNLKLYACICDYIIRIYVSLIKDGKTSRLRLNTDIIDVVIDTIKKYKDIYNMQAGCSFLHILSTESQLADKLRLSDAINVCLSTAVTTAAYNEDTEQLIEAIDAAGAIAQMSSVNMRHFASIQGFMVIDNILEKMDNERVANACISIVRNLTLSEDISRDILNTQVLDKLIKCMSYYMKKNDEEIIENCCGAIRNLTATSYDICRALIDLNVPAMLTAVLHAFGNNAEIVFQCAWAIHEFAERDSSPCLFPDTTGSLLRQLLTEYNNNVDIVVKIKLALSSLKMEGIDVSFSQYSPLISFPSSSKAARRSSISNVCLSLTTLYQENITEDQMVATLKALETLCIKDSVRRDIHDGGAIDMLFIALKKFPKHLQIHLIICSIFYFLSGDEQYCDSLIKGGILETIKRMFFDFDNEELVIQCLKIINNLCSSEKSCSMIVKSPLLGLCIDKIYIYKNQEIFVELGVNILFQISLSLDDLRCLSVYSLPSMLSEFYTTIQENLSLLIRVDILIYKLNKADGIEADSGYNIVPRVIEQIKKQINDVNEYNNIRQNIVLLCDRESYRLEYLHSNGLSLLNQGYKRYTKEDNVVLNYLRALTALTSGYKWTSELNEPILYANIMNIIQTTTNIEIYKQAIDCLVNALANIQCRIAFISNNYITPLLASVTIIQKRLDIAETFMNVISYFFDGSDYPNGVLDALYHNVFDLLYKYYSSTSICTTVSKLVEAATSNSQMQYYIYKYAPKSLLDTFSVSLSMNVAVNNTLPLLISFASSPETVDLLINNNICELFFSILCKSIRITTLKPILNAYICLCHYDAFLRRIQSNNDLVRRLNTLSVNILSDQETILLCQNLLHQICENDFKPSPPETNDNFDLGPEPDFPPPEVPAKL